MLKYILSIWAGIFLFGCSQTLENSTKNLPPSVPLYKEMYRPQFHFSPPSQWMNDPNGMVYFEGEYHLFYQYYPDSTIWGPMHWAHAVSTDMVKWQHLPIALYPDSLGYIFSGSAVVDWNNTSGFGTTGQAPMIAIYTYHDMEGERNGRTDYQYQAIAYSNDKGRSWTKYKGNPVLPNSQKIKDFRDPKVFWHEDSKQWIMIFAAHDHVKIWGSPDLKNWMYLSDFGKPYGNHEGIWECPDLFPMKVKGTNEQKWVLLQSLNPGHPNGGSGTQYFVGNFDGKNFELDPSFEPTVEKGKSVWLDLGRDNYAGVTWSDVPATDGRKLWLGWMSNWDYAQVVPTTDWRSTMTLPRTLTLHKTKVGYRLSMAPITELQSIRGNQIVLPPTLISESYDISDAFDHKPTQAEFILEFEIQDLEADFGVELSNTKGETYRIGFNGTKNAFYSDRTKAGSNDFSKKFGEKVHFAPRLAISKTVKMQLFFDASSVELFGDDGNVCITDLYFPTEDFKLIKLYSTNGVTQLLSGQGWELESIWK